MDSNPSVSLLATPRETPSSGNGSISIRAPPSLDSDSENVIKFDGNTTNIIRSRSSSTSSFSSYESSESDGFLSGEEGFETASERPFVVDPDDEIVGLEEDIIVPFAEEEVEVVPVVGFESMRPKARISGDDDDDIDEGLGDEDDGVSNKARVGDVSNDVVVEIPVVKVSKGGQGEELESGIAVVDDRTIDEDDLGENHGVVLDSKNEVLEPEKEETSLEKSPILDSDTTEFDGNVVSETPGEVFRESKEVALPANALQQQEGVELISGVEEEKKIEVFDSDEFSDAWDFPVDSKQLSQVEENMVEFPVENITVMSEELIEYTSPGVGKISKSKSEEDPLVETNQQALPELKVGLDLQQEVNKVSETKVMEVPLESNVSSDTTFVEEPVDLKLVEADTDLAKVDEPINVGYSSSGQNTQPETNPVTQVVKLEPFKSKSDGAEVEKDDYLNDGANDTGSASLPLRDNSENHGLETEPLHGSVTYEPVLQVAANGIKSNSSDTVDFDDSAQLGNSKSAELNSTEDELQAVTNLSLDLVENGDAYVTVESREVDEAVSSSPPTAYEVPSLDRKVKQEGGDAVNTDPNYEEENAGSVSNEDAEGLIFNGSVTAEQIMKELERVSGISSRSGATSSQDNLQEIDGKIVTDSDEEVDTDEENDGKELFDSAALTALLKAASGASDGGNITITSSDGSKLFSVERPAGMGSSIPSLRQAPRSNRPNLFTTSDVISGGESDDNLSKETKEMLEKVQLIRVKFLRLLQRLGQSPDNPIASQVLYRLILASGRYTSQNFGLEAAKRTAIRLEEDEKHDLDFSLNILVLGKTGVGKSATINSIFGEEKALIDAFEPTTTAVKEINGTVDGVKIRVFDTPGLRSSIMDQSFNQKVLSSVKKITKKYPPDIVLYVDRLDTQTRDLNDLPLLRLISNSLGSSIWRSSIVTFTHAASAPPEGPSGSPLSYEVFVAQRSHIVQQAIGQSVGDLRLMNPSVMNPVSLAENHPSCRKNREGHRVLPNGQSWRPQLLLLVYSIKILSEANALAKPQNSLDPRKLFGFRTHSPPLPYLLSTLLQSRAHPKLPNSEGVENVDSDIDLGDLSDSDQEEEDEYDQLPPFKPLRKNQVANLSKEQRKAYFEEYEYRVKLLQKKQWREELKRLKKIKKKGKDSRNDNGLMGEDNDQENGSPATLPVPLPDMILPNSFDGDNPAYRYRFLEPTSQLLARPVLDNNGWDHDCGYDGVSLEENLAIAGRFPAGVAVQITKDKKEFNIHLDSNIAAKYRENGSTIAGFDVQNIGKQLAYIIRGETKFKNLKKNKTTAGVSVTFLGENVATGLKVEDQIAIGKRVVLVGSTGAVRSQGDTAYGANFEARLKDKDFPIDQDQSTLGLSLMKWRGDLALGANLQSQISIGGGHKVAVRVSLNNKLSGQITVRTSSSDQLQIALIGILPIAISIFRSIWPGSSDSYSAY
ncbi:hypothetical protein GIB67_015115 [Kingdonia uniflora]|uniref:AIG1-type G domain-containing protein n=1 Tax=Kingdonia uniflora TaxID=39325 RepID=A0A7J7LJ84_9MAGN|nr:hypothetical protein GIB67_015115 [Kingdonia uniflora]